MTTQILVTAISAYLVIKGDLSVGAIIACSMISAKAIKPFENSLSLYQAFKTSREAYERINLLFDDYEMNINKTINIIEVVEIHAININFKDIIDYNLTLKSGQIFELPKKNDEYNHNLLKLFAGIQKPISGNILINKEYDLYETITYDFFDNNINKPIISYMPHNVIFANNANIYENISSFETLEMNEKILE